MAKKTIAKIIAPAAPHFVGDGFRVHNFIPGTSSMREMDPFIMLDYNSKYTFGPSEIPRGVGVHPHKGFETVTIAYKGKVEHGDSTGSGGVIHEGDVQWMTAASGVLHKEFHEKEWSKKGGEFQMVQLWVNLPAKDKKIEPKYQNISKESIPVVNLGQERGIVEVIAGSYNGQEGAAFTFTPINMLNVKLKAGASCSFDFPADFTTSVLMIEGDTVINSSDQIPQDHFALFKKDGNTFEIEAKTDAVILVLSGQPINEPIAAYGPFVMNSEAEIKEAIQEFNTGKFGHLED